VKSLRKRRKKKRQKRKLKREELWDFTLKKMNEFRILS